MKTSKVYLAVILLAAISLNGCAVISWTVAQFQRPKKVKALYNLPLDKRVLVLVDGCGDGSDEVTKRDLTEHLNFQLLKHKLVREIIRYDALLAYRLSTPNFHKVSSVEIGEKFKADLIIRVKIDRFTLKDNPDDVLWH